MALHDFRCSICGKVSHDINIPISIGAVDGAPPCLWCGETMDWIPQVGRMDAYEPSLEFDTFDGRNQPVHIDSLKKLRQVERESEIHARNGEGQPMVWRKYSQDRSNVHVSTLGESPTVAPTRSAAERFGSTLRKSAEAPDTTYGPGVSDSNTSALKD